MIDKLFSEVHRLLQGIKDSLVALVAQVKALPAMIITGLRPNKRGHAISPYKPRTQGLPKAGARSEIVPVRQIEVKTEELKKNPPYRTTRLIKVRRPISSGTSNTGKEVA